MASGAPAAVRAFFALELDAMSIRRVARTSDRVRLASGAPRATWTPPDRIHVTLKFIADLPVGTIDPLAESVRTFIAQHPAPAACPFRLEAFPNLEQARVVVAELLDASGVLAGLAEGVDSLAHGHGVAREERPFRPHVTLARLKLPYDARRWLRPEIAEGAGGCTAVGVTLFRSDLDQTGPAYVPLARVPFSSGPS